MRVSPFFFGAGCRLKLISAAMAVAFKQYSKQDVETAKSLGPPFEWLLRSVDLCVTTHLRRRASLHRRPTPVLGGSSPPAGFVSSLRSFIDTKHFELERSGPPLVDAHRHAFSQAIYRKRCAISTKSCTRRQGPRSRVTVKRQRPSGQ